ncbi:MAG: hypothetical protein PSW75_08320, partial [bacterium]|nr:hypothetical protein [bacterium]
RRGRCPESLLGKQVRAGESILVGQALCDVQHFIRHDGEGRKLAHRHTAEEIAHRAPPGWVPPVEHQTAELVAKGIHPALAARHALRRRHHAAVMHEAGNSPAGPTSAPPPEG